MFIFCTVVDIFSLISSNYTVYLTLNTCPMGLLCHACTVFHVRPRRTIGGLDLHFIHFCCYDRTNTNTTVAQCFFGLPQQLVEKLQSVQNAAFCNRWPAAVRSSPSLPLVRKSLKTKLFARSCTV